MIYTTVQRQFMIWHITGKATSVYGASLLFNFSFKKLMKTIASKLKQVNEYKIKKIMNEIKTETTNYDLIFKTDYQQLINSYYINCKPEQIRRRTIFDCWFIFNNIYISSPYEIKYLAETKDSFDILIEREKEHGIAIFGKYEHPRTVKKYPEIYIEERFATDEFINKIKDKSIKDNLINYIEMVSEKASREIPNVLELKDLIPILYNGGLFRDKSTIILKNALITEIIDPVCGFNLPLTITDDNGIVTVKMAINVGWVNKDGSK